MLWLNVLDVVKESVPFARIAPMGQHAVSPATKACCVQRLPELNVVLLECGSSPEQSLSTPLLPRLLIMPEAQSFWLFRWPLLSPGASFGAGCPCGKNLERFSEGGGAFLDQRSF